MSQAPPAATADPRAEARVLRRRVAEADDARVREIVRVVEGLARRGDADSFLAPVRDRLRELRPARKMRLTRLLFQPLDPVIVAAKDWRIDTPLIPRTALAPITSMVQLGLGAAGLALEQLIGEVWTTQTDTLAKIGAQLWPQAARLLDQGQMDSTWTMEGLPEAAFHPLRQAIAFVLGAEAMLADLERPATPIELINQRLTGLLTAAAQQGPTCWGILLGILLQRFPIASAPLRAANARTSSRAQTDAAQLALNRAADWVQDAASGRGVADLSHAADEVARQVALLDAMAEDTGLRARAIDLRAALQASCAARFEAGLQTCILARLASSSAEPPDGHAIAAIEHDARSLRRLEREARRLGGGPTYDLQLREAAGQVMGATQVDPFDRVRLIEILAGTKLAMQARQALDG